MFRFHLNIGQSLVEGFAVIIIGFLINVVFIKVVWGVVVPYLFPKLVKEGYVRGEMSWLIALLIALCLMLILR